MPHDEDRLLDALARLHAAGQDELVEGSRFVGMFRAHGLLAPVWDLPVGTGAEALEEPADALRQGPRRGAGRRDALSTAGAGGPLRAGQPPGHDPLTTRQNLNLTPAD